MGQCPILSLSHIKSTIVFLKFMNAQINQGMLG